ncbi:hypothetical protein MKW94_003502 [Papaver nudicaule]|uniref:Uncharacterized protein n=1 Tax=Papaver nudicaule TaxID=74823 RepID=A0AA41VZD2_PAPNU|nr:hypothetical protein [Papaver nudicaule]
MAGMLPGVELARRRRTSHHLFDSNCRHSTRHQRIDASRIDTSSTMDEAALKARRRLEEKLRGLAPSSSGLACSLKLSCFTSLSHFA